MGARDRFGSYADPARSPLQRYIYNACDPANYEPNLGLNLEVVDLINSKKGSAPREAAITIVNLVNSRNANVSLLALTLLDNCVKNCGYPFHLQISTKEFLNELVRRFPERPPLRTSRVQQKILELIEEWRQTICQSSRYKEDLGFIRDMHRLLLYKGYMFPEVRREDAAVLNPTDNLQSAEEMEEEEKEAQSAKLQELIRRGGPEDLREANQLMKVMAGYDTKHKTDYRAKAAEEVSKVQEKAKILEEMLQNFKPGDSVEGDVFEVRKSSNAAAASTATSGAEFNESIQDLANALQSAHPKIQKMCEEESDDSEAVSKLLQINDSIYRTIERYKLVKAGDVEGASKIAKGTLGTTTGVAKNADNELSLIDLDPQPDSNGDASASTAAAPVSAEGDLLGLSFQDEPQGAGGAISLSPSLGIGIMQQSIPAPSAPQPATSGTPQSQTPIPTPTPPAQKPSPTPPADPFASLVSAEPRTSSPFNPPQSSHPPAPASSSLLDLGGAFSSSPAPPQPAPPASTGDDEWTFTSALPEDNLPMTSQLVVLNTSIKIDFTAKRNPGENKIYVVASFSNNTTQPITDLHFQLAIEKAYSLQLFPQSGRQIGPLQQNGVKQELHLNGVEPGNGNTVKLRYKVSYKIGQETKDEDGRVPPLGIS